MSYLRRSVVHRHRQSPSDRPIARAPLARLFRSTCFCLHSLTVEDERAALSVIVYVFVDYPLQSHRHVHVRILHPLPRDNGEDDPPGGAREPGRGDRGRVRGRHVRAAAHRARRPPQAVHDLRPPARQRGAKASHRDLLAEAGEHRGPRARPAPLRVHQQHVLPPQRGGEEGEGGTAAAGAGGVRRLVDRQEGAPRGRGRVPGSARRDPRAGGREPRVRGAGATDAAAGPAARVAAGAAYRAGLMTAPPRAPAAVSPARVSADRRRPVVAPAGRRLANSSSRRTRSVGVFLYYLVKVAQPPAGAVR